MIDSEPNSPLTAASLTAAPLTAAERRAFIARKLFSLSGVLPIGAFLVIHVVTYSSALDGRHAFDQVLQSRSSPYQWLWEVALVWLPLVYHAAYGLVICFEGRPNVHRYPLGRNWAYLWQRLSGLFALAFIGYHTYQVRLPLALGTIAREDLFATLCSSLSATTKFGIPLVAVGYLVGIAAICYHFANGLTTFCASWGLTASRTASRRVAGLSGLVAIVLFAVSANLVLYFATGSRIALTLHDPSSLPAISCDDLAASSTQKVALGVTP